MAHTLPSIVQWDESFDIGSDTLTGVNDEDYLPLLTLTAKLNKLTLKLDRPALSAEDKAKLQAAMKATTEAAACAPKRRTVTPAGIRETRRLPGSGAGPEAAYPRKMEPRSGEAVKSTVEITPFHAGDNDAYRNRSYRRDPCQPRHRNGSL